MFRFYVNEKENDRFILSKETLNHIKVSRVTKKEFICVYKEEFYICKLEDNMAIIIEKILANHEFEGEVIIAAGFINMKRFEWLIQKATELGATQLIPIISENMSAKLPIDIDKKLKRWNDIATSSAEQSYRNKSMVIKKPLKFTDAINLKLKNKYIAHEKEENTPPSSLPTNSIFFVGPEGGFSNFEIEQAKKHDIKVISLGTRILRAETASIFILSRVN